MLQLIHICCMYVDKFPCMQACMNVYVCMLYECNQLGMYIGRYI